MRKTLIPLLLLFLYTGCSDSSTNPPSTSVLLPKVGSWYKFIRTDIDTNGKELTGSQTWVIDSVVESGIARYGKSMIVNVRRTFEDIDGTGNVFLSYSPNGDVEFLESIYPDTVWTLLPFASHTPYYFYSDTVIDGQFSKAEDTTLYLGQETVTVKGVTFKCSKVKISHFFVASTTNPWYSSSTFAFSPKLAYFVNILDIGPFASSNHERTSRWVVVDYELK